MIEEEEEKEVSMDELSLEDWKNINEFYSSEGIEDDDDDIEW